MPFFIFESSCIYVIYTLHLQNESKDGYKFVILLTGFQKKTQKTPPTEIDRAVKLMNEYYEEKRKEQYR